MMTYYALIENGRQGVYTATVMGWPDCTAQGVTRQEALARLRQVFTTRLAQAEIVSLEIELPQPAHPWMKFAGIFKNNALFDEVITEMAAYRRQLDTDSSVP